MGVFNFVVMSKLIKKLKSDSNLVSGIAQEHL